MFLLVVFAQIAAAIVIACSWKSIPGWKIIVGLCATFFFSGYALFHGWFDPGLFEIKQSVRSSTGQFAMVAKRSDHQALNSDQYFVLTADHQLSRHELRHAFYYDGMIFKAGTDCLNIRWKDPQNLEVSCSDKPFDGYIEVQKHHWGQATVSYENIPNHLGKFNAATGKWDCSQSDCRND